ncbi:MAG: MerR family transcriptional regulator, partial [Corynebacterium casei]
MEQAAQEATEQATQPYQESLFDVGPDEQVGYRVPIACQVAG